MHHETDAESDADADADAGAERGDPAPAPHREVVVDGELDMATVPHLLELVRAALEEDAPVVVLDLSAVEFVDCYGLRGLVAARELLLDAGRAVVLPAPSPAITRLLAWTSMTEHFALDSSVHP